MRDSIRRVEYRSRTYAEALPGDECPVDHDPAVPPGLALHVWNRSGQCCEALTCRRPAETVARINTGARLVIEARCSRCLAAGR